MRPGPPSTSRRRPPRRQQQQQQQQKDYPHHHYYQRQRHRRLKRQQQHKHRCGPLGYFLLLLLASCPGRGLAEPPADASALAAAAAAAPVATPAATSTPSTQLIVFQNVSLQEQPPQRQPRKPQNLTIAYLTAVKGELKDRQGLAISGAFSMALDEINNDPNILPEVNLVMRWFDARGEKVEATKFMIDLICENVVAFFGPEGTCETASVVSQAKNVPLISYVKDIGNENEEEEKIK